MPWRIGCSPSIYPHAGATRADVELFHAVCEAIESPGCFLGWRCTRTTEHEMVALTARHGISALCCLDVRNLSVHSAIPRTETPFTQDHKTETDMGPVEKKVYVSIMNTDGDAVWSMLRAQADRFDEPDHGSMPYTWGFLPSAVDLTPGVARYNYERRLPNDYFAAPTSGAMYTYPLLHPDPRAYLRMTRHYMQRTGLRVAYIGNWDDDSWWQEIDAPEFTEVLREEFPEALGFVRGMGESAFEKHYLRGGAPVVFCGEGFHRDSDVFRTLSEFTAANSVRPLFLFLLANHGVTLSEIKAAFDRLPKEEYCFVRLDEFFALVRKADKEGLIQGGELYPDKSGLTVLLQEEARAAWPKIIEDIQAHALRAGQTEAAFVRRYTRRVSAAAS